MGSIEWQTVVVTAAALVAVFVLLRPLLGRREAGSCPSCTAGRSCATRSSPVAAMQPPAGPDHAPR